MRAPPPKASRPAVHVLLLVLVAVFLVGFSELLPVHDALALKHADPSWWQFFTSMWLAPSGEVLVGNIFLCYVFGRAVERSEGSLGLWLTYIMSGLGASLASFWLLPKKAVISTVGSSGAVVGLFAMATLLTRIQWTSNRWVELACLAPFVIMTAMKTEGYLAPFYLVGGIRVGHLVPLVGGLFGAMLALGILRVLGLLLEKTKKEVKQEQQEPGGDEEVGTLVGKLVTRVIKRWL